MTFKISTIAESSDQINWIDCTFRDGGYYTLWDFPPSAVQEYLCCCGQLGVDIVELGFRSPPSNRQLGAHAFTTDEFINSFSLPASLKLAVMVNASDYIADPDILLNSFPDSAADSKVSIIRIAAHRSEIKDVSEIVYRLHDLGFEVVLNIMQCSEIDLNFLESNAELLNALPVGAIYFADSTGSALPSDISALISLCRGLIKHPLGIHAHDNMGFALANSLSALEAGAKWVDTTVMGMGRGPGNAKTEEFCNVIQRHDIEALATFMQYIEKRFTPIKAQYQWGSNPLYFLAGRDRVHPTYVQRMMFDDSFSQLERAKVLAQLGNTDSMSFAVEQLESARSSVTVVPKTHVADQLKHEIAGRPLLLIGGGGTVEAEVGRIKRLVSSGKYFAVACNTVLLQQIDVNARILTDGMRVLADCESYSASTSTLWMSRTANKILLQKKINVNSKIILEDLDTEEISSPANPTQTLEYALRAGLVGGAKSVFLIGFDGYVGREAQHQQNEISILEYDKWFKEGIYSLTPTSYRVKTITPSTLDS